MKISAAHSGRIACVSEKNVFNYDSVSVEVSIFECESSGGVEWLREDSFCIQQQNLLLAPERWV